MSASEDPRPRGRTSFALSRWWPLVLIAVVAVAVAVGLLFFDADPDLQDGIGPEQVGEDVVGSDLVVVDTYQGLGFFVDTDEGRAFVYYGDAEDRFGVGTTVAALEGEVAEITDDLLAELLDEGVRPEQLDLLDGEDVYVRADDIRVAVDDR
jgi:hypothetical protein